MNDVANSIGAISVVGVGDIISIGNSLPCHLKAEHFSSVGDIIAELIARLDGEERWHSLVAHAQTLSEDDIVCDIC